MEKYFTNLFLEILGRFGLVKIGPLKNRPLSTEMDRRIMMEVVQHTQKTCAKKR